MLAACGRALGGGPDAQPDQDGGPDARPPVDAARPDAGPGGCTVPAAPVVLVNEGAPALALSAVALPDGRFAVGAITGWSQDMAGRLLLVDRADLAVRGWASLSEPYVHVGYDPQRAEVVVAAQDNGRTTIHAFDVGSDAPLETGATLLCDGCSPFFQGPVSGNGGVAVAVEEWSAGTVRVHVRPPGADPAFAPGEAITGSTPSLAALPDRLLLVFLVEGRPWAVALDWSGVPLADPTELGLDAEDRVRALAVGPHQDGEVEAAAAIERNGSQVLTRLVLDADGQRLDAQDVADGEGFANELSVSRSGDSLAVVWGETYGLGRVGAHLLAFDRSDGAVQHGPALISPTTTQTFSSYTVWAVAAPHPAGHAVFWGGWHEDTNYGLYGKLVACD
jgi:hypothetical protein